MPLIKVTAVWSSEERAGYIHYGDINDMVRSIEMADIIRANTVLGDLLLIDNQDYLRYFIPLAIGDNLRLWLPQIYT